MTNNSFNDGNSTLKFWEIFQLETLNQKVCRMILGVHKNLVGWAQLVNLGDSLCLLKLSVTR